MFCKNDCDDAATKVAKMFQMFPIAHLKILYVNVAADIVTEADCGSTKRSVGAAWR